jgi:hypothetical protein
VNYAAAAAPAETPKLPIKGDSNEPNHVPSGTGHEQK